MNRSSEQMHRYEAKVARRRARLADRRNTQIGVIHETFGVPKEKIRAVAGTLSKLDRLFGKAKDWLFQQRVAKREAVA